MSWNCFARLARFSALRPSSGIATILVSLTPSIPSSAGDTNGRYPRRSMPKERRGVPTAGEQGPKGRREDGLAQDGNGLVEAGREPRGFCQGDAQAKFNLRPIRA